MSCSVGKSRRLQYLWTSHFVVERGWVWLTAAVALEFEHVGFAHYGGHRVPQLQRPRQRRDLPMIGPDMAGSEPS